MIVVCTDCSQEYDDAVQVTYCPHTRFLSDENARQKDMAFSMCGKKLRLNHDPEGKIGTYTVQSISQFGLVTLRTERGLELRGEFAPHCFTPVIIDEDTGKEIPKMDALFEVHMLNEIGKEKALIIAEAFNGLLNVLGKWCPASRELSIAKTKLEESCFFAKKAMASLSENQQ